MTERDDSCQVKWTFLITRIKEIIAQKGQEIIVMNIEAMMDAREQFEKARSEQLYFLIASDFELYYPIDRVSEIKSIQRMKPKTYLVAPGGLRNEKELLRWQKALQAHVVRIHNEREIINTVCKIISNR